MHRGSEPDFSAPGIAGVLRLVFISGLFFGLLWSAIGYAILGAVERQWGPQMQSAYHRPIEEESRQYWTGVLTAGCGAVIVFGSILGLGGVRIGRWIVATAAFGTIAISAMTFVEVILPRLYPPARFRFETFAAFLMLWTQALTPLLMSTIYPLIACMALLGIRGRKVKSKNGGELMPRPGARAKVFSGDDVGSLPLHAIPAMAYRTAEAHGPPSAWLPMGRALMIVGVLLGILLTLTHGYLLRRGSIEIVLQTRTAHSIAGIGVSNNANWLFEAIGIVAAMALIVGGLLSLLHIRFGRPVLLAAGAWFAFVAICNFLTVAHMSTDQFMDRLGPVSRGIVAALSMVLYACATGIAVTRSGVVQK